MQSLVFVRNWKANSNIYMNLTLKEQDNFVTKVNQMIQFSSFKETKVTNSLRYINVTKEITLILWLVTFLIRVSRLLKRKSNCCNK